MANALMARMLKTAQKIDPTADVLSNSEYLDIDIVASTRVPLLDLSLSGSIVPGECGMSPGATMFVGDSRTFKTNYMLLMVSSFLRDNPEGVCFFLNSEFGAKRAYWESFGIDMDRVLEVPFDTVEDLKNKTASILKEVNKGDKVIMAIDSISQVASAKETKDAEDGKEVADMTRAKSLNSFWRIITPKLSMKKIPLFCINSYYDDVTNQYAEAKIKGGKQGFLSCDNIWMITRRKLRDSDRNLTGFDFNIKLMKTRACKEDAKIPITVTFEGGIDRYSGLLDIGRALGFIDMRGKGRYALTALVDGGGEQAKSYTKNELAAGGDKDLFEPLLACEAFQIAIAKLYSLDGGSLTPEQQDIMDSFDVDEDGVAKEK